MVLQPPQLMTVESFDQFVLQAENRDRNFEFIAGEIVEVVSNPLSSKIAMRIGGRIEAYLTTNDIGHVTGADGGYKVSGERYIPDAAFISYAKQPELAYEEGYNPNPPDLAVEVLSPGNTDDEIAVKIANYLAAGTTVWLAKALEQQVLVFAPGRPVRVLTLEDTLDGGSILPGFKLAVKDIFPPKRES